jgi:uncharacterized protein
MINELRRIGRLGARRLGEKWRCRRKRPIGTLALSALFLLGVAVLEPAAQEQIQIARDTSASPNDLNGLADRMNANTLTIVTGNPGLVFAAFGNDLAAVLNDGNDLRILPVISQGSAQNVRDVRFLHGIDLGFTVTNILGNIRRSGEIGNLSDKIVYIAKISNDEIHVLTRSDITSMEQLRGRKVNFNAIGSGSELSAHDIFRALKIDVQEVNLLPADALEKLKNGEIAATIVTSGKPAADIASLKASDGYRFLPVPLVGALMDDYLPSKFTNADYPNLIPPGQSVETIAAAAVLIAYNWPKDTDRYRRIDKFVKALFARFAEFQKPPRHPKWRETNLFATIPGWKRFEGAEEMLTNYRDQVATGQRPQFGQAVVDRSSGRPLTERDRNELFEGFLKWSATTGATTGSR